jgi:hypothetical protein
MGELVGFVWLGEFIEWVLGGGSITVEMKKQGVNHEI